MLEDLIKNDEEERVVDNECEGLVGEGIGNQAHVNEKPVSPENQVDVIMVSEFRNLASTATKFKHPVPKVKNKADLHKHTF